MIKKEKIEVGLVDNIKIVVKDIEGNILSEQVGHNLVTNAGRNLIRDFLLSDRNKQPTNMAVGTGTTAAAVGDTALVTEVYRDSITLRTSEAYKATFQLFIPEDSANGNTLTEAGLFSVANGISTLYARFIFASSIPKTSANSVTITWDITITAN